MSTTTGIRIRFNGYEFTASGRSQYSRTARMEGDAQGALPRRELATYTIHQTFTGDSFADNAASYSALLLALRVGEGRLVIDDEFGSRIVDVLARPQESNLPEQWGQYLAEITVSFAAIEEFAEGTQLVCGGVTLRNVTGWRESVRTDRATFQINNRRETIVTISASGRIPANPQLPVGERRAQLLALQAQIRALGDSKESRLVFGSLDETVRVDSVDAELGDGSSEINWTLACSYRRFPSGGYTEAEYTVADREDFERGERILSVRGRVTASSITAAKNRARAIINTYRSASRTLRSQEITETLVEGTDGSANHAIAEFSAELGEPMAEISWSLSVSTREDIKAGQVVTTYSGRVTGGTAGAALAQARTLGAGEGARGIRMTSTETVATAVVIGSRERFVEVTFSYEYVGKGKWVYAEVTRENDVPTFGRGTVTISGSVTAETEDAALSAAQGYRMTGVLVISQRESAQSLRKDNERQFVRVEFSYVYHRTYGGAAIEYGQQVSRDFTQREVTTTYSGTVYAADYGTANGMITGLYTAEAGKLLRDERTRNVQQAGEASAMISVSFSLTAVKPMAANDEGDILEAEFSLATTYSINRAVITPIPFGTPHVQENCGRTPGLKVASGTVTAVRAATARDWSRGKRSLATQGGYEDPPEERVSTVYHTMSGEQVRFTRFQFTYAARFTNLPLA